MLNDAEIIYQYSRAQAIADGVLVDVTTIAKEAGFKVPTAITQALYAKLDPTPEAEARGQSFTGRLWDVLNVAITYARRNKESGAINFKIYYDDTGTGSHLHPLHLRAVMGPGDNAEPVLTIGFPDILDKNDVE